MFQGTLSTHEANPREMVITKMLCSKTYKLISLLDQRLMESRIAEELVFKAVVLLNFPFILFNKRDKSFHRIFEEDIRCMQIYFGMRRNRQD